MPSRELWQRVPLSSAARRGRLTPSRMAKVRTILDEAVQKLAVLLDE